MSSTASRSSRPSSCTGSCRAGCASLTRSGIEPGSCSATRLAGAERVAGRLRLDPRQRRVRRPQRSGDNRGRGAGAPRRHVPRLRPPRHLLLPGAWHPGPLRLRLPARHRHPRAVPDRWTSTPGSRCGWAIAGGRSTRASTRRASAGVPIGRGRDAVDVAMVTTYGAATLERMTVWADEDRARVAAGGSSMVVDTLGDLIATLGSIDDDEIDWQNIRQATVLIHQTFRYDYPGPITDLRQRLIVVPPDWHGHQRLATHKLRVSGCNLECERSYDSFGNVVLDLTLEEVESHVEFDDLGGRRARDPRRRQREPRRLGFDRRFGEPSRLTRPDEALRAVAAELRASGAARSRPRGARLHPRARPFRLRVGRHERRDDGGRGLGRGTRRLSGLRALHGRALQALRPAGPLRLRPPARRRRHARVGRGAARGCGRGRHRRSRSIRRTTAAPARATSRSPSAATTATSRRPRGRSRARIREC